LQRHIMAELGFEQPLDPDRPLNEVGLDSLRAVKLSITLEQEFGIPISVPELIRGPTINEFADHLGKALAAAPANAAAAAAATSHEATPASHVGNLPAHAAPISAILSRPVSEGHDIARPPSADVAVTTPRHHGGPELQPPVTAPRAYDSAA